MHCLHVLVETPLLLLLKFLILLLGSFWLKLMDFDLHVSIYGTVLIIMIILVTIIIIVTC